ncbi:uncharacterized protein LOC113394808 [Vanessa tameamea]|uniref:Uncharacterized protein LOC113394808 n=1 Tax=Vanessa tameamea TaxID=334116 RepID=A0A8B8HTP4_VANTA
MKCYGLGLLTLFGLIHYGSTILCYECNSASNSMCSDAVLPDSMKRNCSDHDRGVSHTLCRKMIQHVDYGINGHLPESRVIRGCGWDDTRYKGVCYHRSGYGGRQEVCSCFTDLCNGASDFSSHPHIVVSFILICVFKSLNNNIF